MAMDGMDDGIYEEGMDEEPALVVVDQSNGDDRRSRAEKKMRKQMRDKMVRQDHQMAPDDKKSFLKQIQKDLRKLADPQTGPAPLAKKGKKAVKRGDSEKKAEVLRQLYDESQVLKMNQEELKRLEWLDKSVNHSHGLKNRHEPQGARSRSGSRGRRMYVREGLYQDWTNTFARSTVYWDPEKDLLDGEKTQVQKPQALRRSPDRCCGNSPGKTHKGYCHLAAAAKAELTQDPFTGKWSKPKSAMAMGAD